MSVSGDSKDDMNLIINYIPNHINEDGLRALFTPFGNLKQCKVVRDRMTGNSCGYGFVLYDSKESGMNAINALNGMQIDSKRLKVSIARPNTEHSSVGTEGNNLYFSGLPQDMNQEALLKLIGQYGTVTESKVLTDAATGLARGIAFARMTTVDEARATINALNGTVIEGQTTTITVKFADTAAERDRRKVPYYANNTYRPMHPSQSNYRYNPMSYQGGSYQGPPQSSNGFLPQSSTGYGDPNSSFFNSLQSPAPLSVPQSRGGYPQDSAPSYMYQHPDSMNYLMPNPSNPSAAPQSPGQPPLYGMPPHQSYPQSSPGGRGYPQQGGYGSPTPKSAQPGVCLFVYHVPQEASEADLFNLFRNSGEVLSCKIMKDLATGRSKGFGFVNMSNLPQAQQAIQSLNGCQMGNKFLKVSFKK